MRPAISINPATGEKIGEYERISLAEAREKAHRAHQAFLDWKDVPLGERATPLRRLSEILTENKERYARLAVLEMGKTIVQARKEIDKCAWVCRFYAEHAAEFLEPRTVETEATKSYVAFQPLGVVLAIMPWNFPFYQVIRFAAPALMAGNAGVLKHASNVQGCAQALQEMFEQAGFPPHVFTNLNVEASAIAELIADPAIAAVTLTGSDAAGREVAAAAGSSLKKTVLELGGSDAYIVLDDADLETATELALNGRMQNNGQTCIAAKRFVVLSGIYDDFVDALRQKMIRVTMGDPLDESTFLGPLARLDLRDQLHEQVHKTIRQGARLVCGGAKPAGPGAYYPATILADVLPGMEAFDNELFGPVAAVIHAENVAHAVELANRSRFGLGSGVITADTARGEQIALQLEAGNSFVNTLVVSDPRLPFGGIKHSGYGRELSSFGIREFVNIKSVWIK
ncbi:MAG: NAD-dependent succinate-semialdehyde dehydrogenase [Desulfovibrio sp.]|jgi:succinate-semialdehyde dehydrogenase/glutarate-semialdehyde dehydrogenase|nr:NAD-dependent succinate-semialdehyde dehydrogenase [Desulfovibrio sp.]